MKKIISISSIALLLFFCLLVTTNAATIKWEAFSADKMTLALDWPQNIFDITGWASYGIFIVALFAIPTLISFTLGWMMFTFYLLRCCGLCGGRKQRIEGYSKTQYRRLAICYLIFLILFGIITFAALGCAIRFFTDVDGFLAGTVTLLGSVFKRFEESKTTIDKTVNSAKIVFKKLNSTLAGVGKISVPLVNVKNIINGMNPKIDSIVVIMGDIGKNVVSIKKYQDGLAARPELSGVPPSSSIPDPSANIEKVKSGKTAVNEVEKTLTSVQSSVDEGVSSASAASSVFLDTGVSLLNSVEKQLTTFINEIEVTTASNIGSPEKRKLASDIIIPAEVLWVFTYSGYFLVPFILFILGFLGVILNTPCGGCCFRFLALYVFMTFTTFFILGSVQLVVFAVVKGGCGNYERVLLSLNDLDLVKGLPAPFNQIKIGNAAVETLSCKGDTNLAGIAGIDLGGGNLTGSMGPIMNQFNQTIQKFDLNTITNGSMPSSATFTDLINSMDVKFNLTGISDNLATIKLQLNNMTRFNFSETAYDKEIQNLNDESKKVGGAVFGRNNFTRLDSTTNPYSANKNYFDGQIKLLTNLDSTYKEKTSLINGIRTNITHIETHLGKINNSLTSMDRIVQDLKLTPGLIDSNINSITSITDNLKKNATNLLFSVQDIFASASGAVNLTKCSFIGDFHRTSIQYHLCGQLPYISLIGGLIALIGGFLVFFSFACLLEGTKILGHNTEEYKKVSTSDRI